VIAGPTRVDERRHEAGDVGDEPLLLAGFTPTWIARDRAAGAMAAVAAGARVIVLDDGFQNPALVKDLSIVVTDAARGFGNGRCLPAGPLREDLSRLNSVDMIVANAKAGRSEFLMEYETLAPRSLRDESQRADIDDFRGRDVHAVAGIGNPARFFSYLRGHQLRIVKHEFPDHHRFRAEDLQFGDDLPVVMTEKDAVKCRPFAGDDFWYLPIEARMSPAFQHRFTVLLKEIADGQKAA